MSIPWERDRDKETGTNRQGQRDRDKGTGTKRQGQIDRDKETGTKGQGQRDRDKGGTGTKEEQGQRDRDKGGTGTKEEQGQGTARTIFGSQNRAGGPLLARTDFRVTGRGLTWRKRAWLTEKLALANQAATPAY